MFYGNLALYNSFFFVGIGGVSMSALAKILHQNGKFVAGYDRCESDYTKMLDELGLWITYDVGCDISKYDCIVYTDAIPPENRIFANAKKLNKTMLSRGELLSIVSLEYGNTIAVSGCHGKTTCTAMIAHIFEAAKMKFTCHIGGNDLTFANAACFGRDYFITEACEYKQNFLKLKPGLGIILNTAADHLECYNGPEGLKCAYAQFAANSKKVISLYTGKKGEGAITFGFDDRADYFAKRIKSNGGKCSFNVYECGAQLGEVSLNVYGKHNVLNALAAAAAARYFGIGFKEIAQGLNSFVGVKRRFENIGTICGISCIADYAHHPDEIKAVLKTARQTTKGKLYVVFQPHTYSRTKNMFKQFVSALSPVKNILIYKTFAAREYYDDAGSALALSSALKRSVYGDSPADILYFASKAQRGDMLLILGAGDIYDIALSLKDAV